VKKKVGRREAKEGRLEGKGAKEGKITKGEREFPLSNSGIKAEVKLRFRNSLYPWIRRYPATESHV